jgi:hypothetical protein
MAIYRLVAFTSLLTLAGLSALDSKAMMGEPPKSLGAYERRRLETNGVKGTLFFNCDDACTVAVNGKEVGKSSGRGAASAKVKLRPGDVICVLARNMDGNDGLALVFKAVDGKTSFSTSCEGWYEYVPPDPKTWGEVADLDNAALTSCRLGTNSKWKGSVEDLSGLLCPMCIWGGSGHTTTYILHVATYADLADRGK